MNRWLSFLLAFTLIISSFPEPVAALAFESIGEPSAQEKLEDEGVEQLEEEKESSFLDAEKLTEEQVVDGEKETDTAEIQAEEITDEETENEEDKESSQTANSEELKAKVQQSVEKAKQYYLHNPPDHSDKGSNIRTSSHSDFWVYSALWASGFTDLKNDFKWKSEDSSPWAAHTYWTKGIQYNHPNQYGPGLTHKERPGAIIGGILLGKNPYHFGNKGRNLVQDLTDIQKENGGFSDIFGEPWVMIALDLVDETNYDREGHFKHVLSLQSERGSFGGADSTGWMLTALAPYMHKRDDVKEAIEKAVEWAHTTFLENDEFPGMGGANSNSTAGIIMGLAAVGEDLYSDKWIKDGHSLLDQLLEYQQEDGSFWWKKTTPGAVSMATEQSLLALATVVHKESAFVRLKKYKNEHLDRQATVTFRVEGITETIVPETEVQVETFIEEPTALEATKQALNKAGIPFEESHGFITSINGEEQGSFHTWDGWQYKVGDVFPEVGAGEFPIKNGDEIVWFYGNESDLYQGWDDADHVDKLTLRSEVSVPSSVYEGDEIEVTVIGKYHVYDVNFNLIKENQTTAVKDALVQFNGKTYPTDKHGVARIPADEVKAGTYELKVTKDIENSYPRILRQSKKIVVKEISDPVLEIDGVSDAATVQDSTLTITATAKDYKGETIEPKVFLNNDEVQGQKSGTYKLTLQKGANTIEIRATDATGRSTTKVYEIYYVPQATEDTVTISIVISKDSNEIPLVPTEVEIVEGDTAFDVLKRVTKQHNIPMEYRWQYEQAYVESIGGVGEFDRGGGSGWMFTVNRGLPDRGASEVYLIPGDRIEWQYTLNLGEDIETDGTVFSRSLQPSVEVTHLPNHEIVDERELTFTVAAKSYFGTVLQPTVTINDHVIQPKANDEYVASFNKGKNVITIEAIDSKGRTTVETYEITYVPKNDDILASDPTLTVDCIKDGETFKHPNVTISVTAKDYLGKPLQPEVVLNGNVIPVHNNQYKLTLKKGKNTVTITAEDRDGRKTTKTFTITYDGESKDIRKMIDEVSKHILSQGVKSEWEAIGLAKAGKNVPPAYYKNYFLTHVKEQVVDANRKKITDIERLVLAAGAIGLDAKNINGTNLVELIYNNVNWPNGLDSMTAQGNNGPIFALIALDSGSFSVPNDARWTREKLIHHLLNVQNNDGSWSLDDKATTPSYDITAMALIALAPYQSDEKVKKAVDRAVAFLAKEQGESGGYYDSFNGGISSETTSQVIIGLTAVGIDPTGSQFTKKQGNLLDHLLSFRTKDGAFEHVQGDGSNEMATEQALQALVAYELFVKGEGPLYLFKRDIVHEEQDVKAGQEIAINDGKSKIKLSNDLPEGTKLEITVPSMETLPKRGVKLAGDIINVNLLLPKGYKGTLKHTLTLSVNAGVQLDKARIYYFNETSGQWEFVGGEVNAEERTITVEVDHFSIYAVLSDTEGPTDVKVKVKEKTTDRITLSLSAYDPSGIQAYVIYRDGKKIATVEGTKADFTDTGLTADKTYHYSVKAIDQLNNESMSNTLTVTTKPKGNKGSTNQNQAGQTKGQNKKDKNTKVQVEGHDKTTQSSSTKKENSGEALPKTATQHYNLIAIGTVLLALGFAVWMYQRRKPFVK